MSLIGILTATEKQVHLGWLHLRHIQWPLKKPVSQNHWKRNHLSQSPNPSILILSDGFKRQTFFKVSHYTFSAMLFRSLQLTQEKTEALSPETSVQEACGSSKKASCMLSRTKGHLLGPKIVPGSLYLQDSSHSYRQHYSGCLYKQGGRHEVEPIVCTSVEKPDLVLQEASDSEDLAHSRLW